MAYKLIMNIINADYTTHDSAQNYVFYKYGDMILNYGGASFWAIGSLFQLLSLANIAVDINLMFWE